jgi:hypothetical protein
MTKKTGTFTKTIFAIAAVVSSIAIIGSARPAMASTANVGPVTQVEYLAANASNPMLFVQLNSNGAINYVAQQASPGCGVPALSIDTVKMFLSIAQSALLAGKNATIYTNLCGTTNYIYDVVMPR